MPAAASNIWNILYTVSRYLFPFLAVSLVLLLLFYLLSESRIRREKARMLPGGGTVGELVVLSGGKNLDVNTWFPVPREGVMGAVRSCDLVIPCPGVRPKHLDFSWKDGIGLLVYPHSGCEALVNGVPVTCKSNRTPEPLVHGSILQIGSAVLRLHLFSALDNTTAPVQPYTPELTAPVRPVPAAGSMPPASYMVSSSMDAPFPAQAPVPDPSDPAPHNDEFPVSSASGSSAGPAPAAARPRRSDRWKEDLGE